MQARWTHVAQRLARRLVQKQYQPQLKGRHRSFHRTHLVYHDAFQVRKFINQKFVTINMEVFSTEFLCKPNLIHFS